MLSGPSGSGKTTLAEKVLQAPGLRKKLVRSISFTTRPKRSGEKDKRDYFFISRRRFLEQNRQKKILEWTRYLGYYYGTPKAHIDKQLAQGRHVLMCLDLRGAVLIKRMYPQKAVTIFVKPPSLGTLRKRIEGRCSKITPDEVRRRLRLARGELLAAAKYDYRLVNGDLSRGVNELKKIILSNIKGV